MNGEVIAYNAACLLCALFVLERGADVFIDHTVAIARRTKIPQAAIALLTAGAEWEELAVIIVSISRNRASLAIGNIVGSTIANILGAFSLALLFHRSSDGAVFERSSTIYCLVLLAVTAVVSVLLALGVARRTVGILLIVTFALYIASISYLIARGITKAPEELSDSDSDSDSDAEVASGEVPASLARPRWMTPLPPLRHHLGRLTLGFVAVVLSGYVMSIATSNIVDELGISDVFAGVVILSIATTIPEKFVAVMSGYRGHMDIALANTVGSNLFLLTLCLGIVWTATDGAFNDGSATITEVSTMAGSSVILTVAVLLQGKFARMIGVGMLTAYVAFIVFECVGGFDHL